MYRKLLAIPLTIVFTFGTMGCSQSIAIDFPSGVNRSGFFPQFFYQSQSSSKAKKITSNISPQLKSAYQKIPNTEAARANFKSSSELKAATENQLSYLKEKISIFESANQKNSSSNSASSKVLDSSQRDTLRSSDNSQRSDAVETGLKIVAAVAGAAKVYGDMGVLPLSAVYGGGGAGAAAVGTATGGLAASGFLGYTAGKVFVENTEWGRVAGSYYGEALADSNLGKTIASWLWGTPGPEDDDTSNTPATVTDNQSADSKSEETTPNGSSSKDEDQSSSEQSSGEEDNSNEQCAEDAGGSCSETASSGEEDSGQQQASTGTDEDSTPNPEQLDVPPGLIVAFLKTPFGKTLLSQVEDAINDAVGKGLLPPPDSTNGAELLAELTKIYPALANMLVRAELKLVAEAVSAATGGQVSQPPDNEEGVAYYVVTPDNLATYLIVSPAIDYPDIQVSGKVPVLPVGGIGGRFVN